MPAYRFRMRGEMVYFFKGNARTPELSAAAAFLEKHDDQEFESPEAFQKVLAQFPGYISKECAPPGSFKADESELLLVKSRVEDVFDVIGRSAKSKLDKYWAGCLGPEDKSREHYSECYMALITAMKNDKL